MKNLNKNMLIMLGVRDIEKSEEFYMDKFYSKVQELGGIVEHAPEKAADRKGYHFYFKDLDGHYWKIAY